MQLRTQILKHTEFILVLNLWASVFPFWWCCNSCCKWSVASALRIELMQSTYNCSYFVPYKLLHNAYTTTIRIWLTVYRSECFSHGVRHSCLYLHKTEAKTIVPIPNNVPGYRFPIISRLSRHSNTEYHKTHPQTHFQNDHTGNLFAHASVECHRLVDLFGRWGRDGPSRLRGRCNCVGCEHFSNNRRKCGQKRHQENKQPQSVRLKKVGIWFLFHLLFITIFLQK